MTLRDSGRLLLGRMLPAGMLLAGLGAALALGPAGAASASLGSVPTEVAAYVTDGGLVARLSDVYGRNAAGAGVDFDATTKVGPITRVYEWTAQRLTNVPTDHPVQLTNNWVAPITIDGKPVGLATIWINPQSVAPELASFDKAPALATALASVPAKAALVRDGTTGAWLALTGTSVAPLVAGSSGLSTPVPVASLTLTAGTASSAAAPTGAGPGLGLAIGAIGVVVVAIVVVLLLPRRRPRRAVVEPGAGEEAAVDAVAEPEPELEPETVAAAVAPVPAPAPAPRPRAKAATPVTKPSASKPGVRATGAATASARPRTQKPPVQKPPVQKPPAQKPPVRKLPTRKPPAPPAAPPAEPDA